MCAAKPFQRAANSQADDKFSLAGANAAEKNRINMGPGIMGRILRGQRSRLQTDSLPLTIPAFALSGPKTLLEGSRNFMGKLYMGLEVR